MDWIAKLPQGVTPSKEPTVVETPVPSQSISSVVFPLIAHKDDQYVTMGTCFEVRRGLVVTARHVVDECLWEFDRVRRSFDPSRGAGSGINDDCTFHLFAVQTYGNAQYIRIFRGKIWLSYFSDIAILQLSEPFTPPPDSGYEAPPPIHLVLDANPPQIGDRLSCFGYSKTSEGKGSWHDVQLTANAVEVHLAGYSSVGECLEVFPKGRDATLAIPCLHTNAPILPGMSGAPIFNDEGHVVGVASRSLPPFDELESWSSYAALIAPLLAMRLDWNIEALVAERGFENGEYLFLDLIAAGAGPKVLGLDRFERREDSLQIDLTVKT